VEVGIGDRGRRRWGLGIRKNKQTEWSKVSIDKLLLK
jgi:hypothetical protein